MDLSSYIYFPEIYLSIFRLKSLVDFQTHKSVMMNKTLLALILSFLISNISFSQTNGDFRSVNPSADSLWATTTSWQTYNSTLSVWQPASSAPVSTDVVYIQAGHVIKLSQNESCKDIYISSGTTDPSTGGDGQIQLGDNVLTITGKLSCYYGTSSIVPATNITVTATTTIPAFPITKNTNSSTGRIKFTGSTRSITQSSECGSGNTGTPETFDIEIAMSGNTASLGAEIKAYNWFITSGTLNSNTKSILADDGTTGQANVTISSTGSVTSSCSGAGNPVISRDTLSCMGTFTMSGFGQLWLTGNAPCMNANSISAVGSSTVFYSSFLNQEFINKGHDALSASFDTYNGINLMNSGIKFSLDSQNVTVNSAFIINDTAYFIPGTGATLAYGPGGILNYSNVYNIKISDSEFPDVNGPPTVIINNAEGVLLDQTKTITSNLLFTAGTLTLINGDLIIASGATITGVDSTKYIVTDDTTGKLTINNISGSRLFPVGCTSYNPVTINNTGGTPDNFSVTVQNTVDNPTADNNKLVQRQWNISEATPGGSNVFLTFQWRSYEEGSNITDHTNFVVGHFTGIVYQDLTCSAVSGSDPYTVTTTTPVSSFSPFVVGKQTVLPVELASFTSTLTGRDIYLTWTTNSEINNSRFEIERTIGTSSWVKTGSVTGNGTSNTSHTYNFNDRNLSTGKYNYRLKQIDNNGNFKYCNLANEVIVGIPLSFSLSQNYPNPFNPTTKINYDLPFDSRVEIKLFDITGRETATIVNTTQQAGYYTVNFHAGSIASGIYFYQINASGSGQNFVKTMRMVVLK